MQSDQIKRIDKEFLAFSSENLKEGFDEYMEGKDPNIREMNNFSKPKNELPMVS